MCLSIFLAFVIGAFLFLTNLAVLLNQTHYKKVNSDFLNNGALVVFAGSVGLVFGLLIVTSHNIWIREWPVLITVIGWILLISSICRLLCHEHHVRWCRQLESKPGYVFLIWIWMLIGLYLVWEAYVSTNMCCM